MLKTIFIFWTWTPNGQDTILDLCHEQFSPGRGFKSKCDQNHILPLLFSGFIIDTRTPAAINNARNKGGGLESDVYYPAWKKITKSIDRFHFLLDSYSKLMEACCDTSVSHDKWLNRLALSSWLTHVKEILNCGCLVAQCVDQVRKINWSFCNLRVDYSFINSK